MNSPKIYQRVLQRQLACACARRRGERYAYQRERRSEAETTHGFPFNKVGTVLGRIRYRPDVALSDSRDSALGSSMVTLNTPACVTGSAMRLPSRNACAPPLQ